MSSGAVLEGHILVEVDGVREPALAALSAVIGGGPAVF